MFVAWRDLRFARGRFALIAAVVALITLLVGFLAGLSGGLASQNVSAVLALPGDRIVLEDPDKGEPSFSESSLDKATIEAWRKADGVDAAVPIGIGQGRATHEGQPIAVALFGVPTDAGSSGVGDLAPHKADEIGLSAGAADQLEAKKGDKITIAEKTYTVAEVSGDLWYSHTPAVTMTPDAWEATDKALGGTGEATALVVSGDADWKAIAKDTGTVADGHIASLSALETFKSEIGSLGLMIAMLFGVSALVVGAFFTVWTMQRAGDIAVLKALGASTASLVRDALGQALIVLVVGIGVGLIAVIGFGTLASQALPFLLNPWTTLAPALAMAVLGLAGASFALRTVTHADPLTALGSNR